ncbi:MAG: Rrf2 family transcriptional regulator [Pseudomonadota bacterium]
MQLNKFTDYSLRILMHLAASERRLTAREIADGQGLSFNHLAKVAQWLAAEGHVSSTRGRGGGMGLARSPEEINLGAVVRKAEAGSALVECMREDGGCCALVPACGLLPYLNNAQEAFFQSLDQHTLADVMQRNSGLSRLLNEVAEQPAT